METINTNKDRKKRNNRFDLTTMVYGKLPPQAKELEEAVLGAMLIDETCKVVLEVNQILKSGDFYIEAHQIICKAIFELAEQRKVEMLLLIEKLKSEETLEIVGGMFYVLQLTNKVVSTSKIKEHSFIIKQKSIQRNLIEFAGVIISKSYDNSEDVFETLHEAESKLKGINYELSEIKKTPIVDIAASIIEKFDTKVYKAKNNIVDENLIYTGFADWDRINGSLFPGVYIVAGRPGMGKGVHLTELACRMGVNHEIGIINGEMTDEQLLTRIGCNLLGVDNYLFKKNPAFITEKEQELVAEAMNETLKLKLHIDNNRYINKIATKIKYWIDKYGIKAVLADFLSLFKVPKELERYFTDKQKIDYCLEILVALSKDYGVPIILYVQMNREILGRHGAKEPNLGDLKNSGSIEELAFQVSFLHRPEYYDANAVTDEMGEDTKGLMYQIIAKHRDGELGRLKYRAVLKSSQLRDFENNAAYNFKSTKDLNDLPF
jgi:replicative DNA helicase